jgi:hypothetical protein
MSDGLPKLDRWLILAIGNMGIAQLSNDHGRTPMRSATAPFSAYALATMLYAARRVRLII